LSGIANPAIPGNYYFISRSPGWLTAVDPGLDGACFARRCRPHLAARAGNVAGRPVLGLPSQRLAASNDGDPVELEHLTRLNLAQLATLVATGHVTSLLQIEPSILAPTTYAR
jgi:hypothetical protein